jgi:hypothetical protein
MMRNATSTSIPAPVGGLNDRDSVADMSPTDALVMDNWWPYPGYVAVRKGYASHVTGLPASCETLVEYFPPSGVPALFAVANGSIYNVTASGAVGAALVTGLSNSRFQETMISTPGGSFLVMVNGENDLQYFNGTTWGHIHHTGSPSISGVDTNKLIHVCLFKNRLFFTENNSMRVWYLPVNSIGGSASLLDFGSIFRQGGAVMACYTWTIDAGSGSDDHFVAISTNGEVAVYRGADPSSASDWGIVGVFSLGKPLGRRCATKYGGDLAVNTQEGLFSLGKGLLSSSIDRRSALTDKIQNTVSQEANIYASSFGWQVALFPEANMLLLNIPNQQQTYQYAQNTITGSWSRFVGMPAKVWLRASTGLYFSNGTTVFKAWTGNLDGANSIIADCLPAFGYFGSKAQNKYFTMVRPYIQTSGTPGVLYGLNVDFAPQDANGALNYSPPTGMVWGSMVWSSMVWGDGLTPLTHWQTVGSVANSAAIRLKVQNNGAEVRFNNVDYLYQRSNSVL